jgi:hypothetical protein
MEGLEGLNSGGLAELEVAVLLGLAARLGAVVHVVELDLQRLGGPFALAEEVAVRVFHPRDAV